MKNTFRQISVILVILMTITINVLADALPINHLNTGVISDTFRVYFVPAGYVFAIWGLIYIGLLAYAVFQALPAQKDNARLKATGWWVVLGGFANSAWIFLWHYQQFVGTLAAMLVLLASLIATYLRLGISETKVSNSETWTVRIPFSIYLGWITVATVANATDVLWLKWNVSGMIAQIWFLVVLGAVLAISTLMSLTRRDVAYILVILWALVGIGYKFSTVPWIWISSLVTALLVALGLLYSLLRWKPSR
jgi:translocator protein